MKSIDYTEVTLKMLIEAKLIKPNLKIYSSTDPVYTGKINENGSITVFIGDKTKNFSYPSGAARAIVDLSVNGWKFWRFIDEKNVYHEISELRKLLK